MQLQQHNIKDQKETVRKTLLKKRSNLSLSDITLSSKEICLKCIDMIKTLSPDVIVGYKSTKNEVNLDDVYHWILDQNISLYFPKKNQTIYHFIQVKNLNDFITGPFNIEEPKSNLPKLDHKTNKKICWLIPGVGFDYKGNRLGYGKGIYDKTLSIFPGKKIGIGFNFQYIKYLQTEDHDIKMDIIITEKIISNV